MSTQYPMHTAHSNPQNAPQATFICKGTEEEGKYKSYVRWGGGNQLTKARGEKTDRTAV